MTDISNVYFTDEVDLDFGIPYPVELYKSSEFIRMMDITEKPKRLWNLEEQLFVKEHGTIFKKLSFLRLQLKYAEAIDPVYYGWTMMIFEKIKKYWKQAKFIVFFGGNRSGKSFCASQIVTHCAKMIPEANIRCFHQSEKRSKEDQQAFIYEALPLDFKGIPVKASKKAKGKNFDITYRQKTGFAGNKVILPPFHPMQVRGAVVNFNTYQQFYANKDVFEGDKLHLWWMDEEAPKNLVINQFRPLIDYHGKGILSFTTINGYTELVSDIISGAETLESVYCDWLGSDVPVVQKSKIFPDCFIFYFHSKDNPFIDFSETWKTAKNSSLEYKKTRLLGIPQKIFISKFPNFHPAVHVVQPDNIKLEGTTQYMSCDPAGGKKFFMIWYAVAKNGDITVYREFPDRFNYGEWAVPWKNSVGKPTGKAGPAQRGEGMGYKKYAELIKKLENWKWTENGVNGTIEKKEDIFERVLDMRYGHREVLSEEDTVDMASEMEKHGIYFRGGYESDIETGIQKINAYLDYDTSRLVDRENRPKLYISADCQNTISALQDYTNEGGREEACKDPIDCLRMALTTDPAYIDTSRSFRTGGQGVY